MPSPGLMRGALLDHLPKVKPGDKPPPGYILGPDGIPIRDERVHEAFRRNELAGSERMVWNIPMLDGIEQRHVHMADVTAILAHDSNHPVSSEVSRLVGEYKKRFLRDLQDHEKRYNKGGMPQISLTREHEPRWPVEHAAMHIFFVMIHDVLVDVSEEDPLLHPKGAS